MVTGSPSPGSTPARVRTPSSADRAARSRRELGILRPGSQVRPGQRRRRLPGLPGGLRDDPMDISVYDDDRLVWCIQVKVKARSLDSLLTGSTSAWRTTATGSCWSTISCPSDEKARPGGAAALTPDVAVKTCNH